MASKYYVRVLKVVIVWLASYSSWSNVSCSSTDHESNEDRAGVAVTQDRCCCFVCTVQLLLLFLCPLCKMTFLSLDPILRTIHAKARISF